MRACFVELQEDERALLPTSPRGEDIADDYLRWMMGRCEACQGRILVAEVEGRVVGFVTVLLAVARCEPDDPIEVHSRISELVVLAAHRGAGIGKSLLTRAEELVRARGTGVLRVSVVPVNGGARGLYAAFGVEEIELLLEKKLE